jgi:hypothetical protein
MVLQMTLTTEPTNFQRLVVILVMLLGYWILAHGTRLWKDFATALIHIDIRTSICSSTGFLWKVHVPWTMRPHVRSMARAAIPLRQTIIGLLALRAFCFHGTNCFTKTKI